MGLPDPTNEESRTKVSAPAIIQLRQEAKLDLNLLVEQAFTVSVTTPIEQIVSELQDLLSRQLTAYIAGVKDGKTITRWAKKQIKENIRPESENSLRAAYECIQILTKLGSTNIARAWLISQNPQLEEISPAEALHEGKIREVRLAARAFIASSGI